MLEKTLILSIISSKCSSKNEKIFEEEAATDILKFLDFIYQKI